MDTITLINTLVSGLLNVQEELLLSSNREQIGNI